VVLWGLLEKSTKGESSYEDITADLKSKSTTITTGRRRVSDAVLIPIPLGLFHELS
jgi:hypothetical protein